MCVQKQIKNYKGETYLEGTRPHQSAPPVYFGKCTSMVFIYSVNHGGKLWKSRMLKLKAKFK